MDTPHGRLGHRITFLRNDFTRWPSRTAAHPAARNLSGNRTGAHRGRKDAVPQRLPPLCTRRLRQPSDRYHTAGRADAGRRRRPDRLAGGTDGTGCDHWMDRSQRTVEAVRRDGPRHTDGAGARSVGRTATPGRSGKASAAMNIVDGIAARWAKTAPFDVLPRMRWSQQRPTYRDAEPAIITSALRRSQRRPSGNWYAVADSNRIRRHPVSLTVAGKDLVAWRGEDGTLHVGPSECPHLGADLSTGKIDC